MPEGPELELNPAQRELLELLEMAQGFATDHKIQMFSGIVLAPNQMLIQDPHGSLREMLSRNREVVDHDEFMEENGQRTGHS